MLLLEHSAILLTFIKLPFVIKIFVLSIFEWKFKTVFTVHKIFSITRFARILSYMRDISTIYECSGEIWRVNWLIYMQKKLTSFKYVL